MRARLSAYYLGFFLAVGTAGPYLTLVLSGRGLRPTQIGLVLAVSALLGTVASPLIGQLNDRVQRPRAILFWSALLSPVWFAGYFLVSGLGPLMGIAVASAITQAAFPLADALALREAGRSADFSYGQVRLWGALGYALMVASAGFLYHRTGLSFSPLLYGAATVPLLAAISRLPGESGAAPAPRAPGFALSGLGGLVRSRPLVAFIGVSFVIMIAVGINGSFLPLYYRALGYPMAWVGMNFTVAAGAEIPLFYLSGRLIARLGTMATVMVGTAVWALKYLLMALAPGVVVVIAAQVLDGIAYALFWSASVEVVNRLAPAGAKSSAQALYSGLTMSLGSIVANALGGWLLATAGPRGLYGAMAAIALAALAFYGVLSRIPAPGTAREEEA